MIVLRFTIGQTTREVRTPRSTVVVGTDPAADVTLAQSSLAPFAFRLVREDTVVRLEVLGEARSLTLRVGDEVAVQGVGVALVGLLPIDAQPPPMFGGYEDDPALPKRTTFELKEPAPSPPVGAAPHGRAPATTASLPPTERRATRKRDRRMAAAAATPATGGAPPPLPKKQLTPEEKAALLAPLRLTEPDFSADLVRQLKRTPFFALSVAFHLLIFLILALLDTTNEAVKPRGAESLVATMNGQEDERGEREEDLEVPELHEPDDKLPEFEELLVDEPPPPPDTKPPPSPFREEEDPSQVAPPPDIGIMPGLRAAARQIKPRKPVPKVDPRQVFTKGTASSSNQQSADAVRAALARGRAGNGASLDQLDENDILVVTGSFDHIERVLDALRLKYTKVAPWALAGPRPPSFSEHKIIFWNCGESLGQRRMAQIGKRLESFVRNGGYLFTTDWGVDNVLSYAFPGILTSNGNRAHLPEMVLDIEPAASVQDHPLLEGVFHAGVRGKWWLEQASFDMAVGRRDVVTVLIESPALRDQFNRSPAVAATFHHGRGRVLHTMGHYYQEAGNLAGTISAHRMALNFVLLRLAQDLAR